MILKVLTLCSFFLSTAALIKDCDTSSVFRPTQLALTPDPPVPGKPIRLTLIFDNTGSEITEGKVYTTLSVNYIPVSPTTEPLCENTACPIVSGINDRSTETTFPSVSGIIKSRVVWTGREEQSLLCIETTFKVGGLRGIHFHF